jgi:hypothetical protein
MQPCFQEGSTSKKLPETLKQCILCVHWWHARVLKSASVRAMGRFASGPGRADGAEAFIWVACSIYQGSTSRFPGYASTATMLLVSESGVSRKKCRQKGRKLHLDLDLGVRGIILTVHIPKTKNIFLGCIGFESVSSAQRRFPWRYPSATTLKSVDGLGAVDTRKIPDLYKSRTITLSQTREQAGRLERINHEQGLQRFQRIKPRARRARATSTVESPYVPAGHT